MDGSNQKTEITRQFVHLMFDLRDQLRQFMQKKFKENNIDRSVYRDINSGGSFGSNPLQQHIGLGKATFVEKIEVSWPVTGKIQVFENPPVNTNIKIKEDDNKFITYKLARLDFVSQKHGLIACSPK